MIWEELPSYSGEGNGIPLQYSCLGNPMDRGAWKAAVCGVTKSRAQLSNFTFTFHFHALEKVMATHSSVLAWRIPGTGEPGGLPSMGSHRVGHEWSDLAAAAAAAFILWPPLPKHVCQLLYYVSSLQKKLNIIIQANVQRYTEIEEVLQDHRTSELWTKNKRFLLCLVLSWYSFKGSSLFHGIKGNIIKPYTKTKEWICP